MVSSSSPAYPPLTARSILHQELSYSWPRMGKPQSSSGGQTGAACQFLQSSFPMPLAPCRYLTSPLVLQTLTRISSTCQVCLRFLCGGRSRSFTFDFGKPGNCRAIKLKTSRSRHFGTPGMRGLDSSPTSSSLLCKVGRASRLSKRGTSWTLIFSFHSSLSSMWHLNCGIRLVFGD